MKDDLQLLQGQGAAVESLAQCMQLSWMCILVGPSGSGGRHCHPGSNLLPICMHLFNAGDISTARAILLEKCPEGVGMVCGR